MTQTRQQRNSLLFSFSCRLCSTFVASIYSLINCFVSADKAHQEKKLTCLLRGHQKNEKKRQQDNEKKKKKSRVDSWTATMMAQMAIKLFLILSCSVSLVTCGRVRVKIYDHRAQHDPHEEYGRGPWHYLGYGYGIEYQYEPDMSYQREKGYGFLQAYGRDHCRDTGNCRQSDPNFFRRLFNFNGGEPFYGAPPAHYEKSMNSVNEPSPYPEWLR